MNTSIPLVPLVAAVLFSLTSLHADIILPPLISDNMLLQQPNAAVWGKADPGENVTVTLGAVSLNTKAGDDGKWRIELEDLKPGVAGEMTVTGKNTLAVRNVAVGEVWVGSGQSNMQWTVSGAANPEKEIAAADYPEIRMFTVRADTAAEPQDEVKGTWQVCSPETVSKWSAVGYFYACQLHHDLKTPVGIINTSWGGTRAEAWTPTEAFRADPTLNNTFKFREDELAALEKRKADYPRVLAEWEKAAEAARAAGREEPKKPVEPRLLPQKDPGALYNAMIHGVTPYTIKGVIWYQGEANVGRAHEYKRLLSAMIGAWRKQWNLGEFPFLIVQLANFGPLHSKPVESKWAELREAQRLVAEEVSNCGLALTIDIGNPADIHPKNKQEVGRRLALIAKADVYGKPVKHDGPLFENVSFKDKTATIRFKPGTAQGLRTTDGEAVKGFAVAGDDRKFHWAEAKIVPSSGDERGAQDSTILVTAPHGVERPVALRYAWAGSPEVNLVNGEALPASSFRTDDWPIKGF